MGDKYLSEVIDYERDMKKHHFMAIYSGVGSGKNRSASTQQIYPKNITFNTYLATLNFPPLNNIEPNKLGIKSNNPYAIAIVIPLSILSIHVVIFVSSVTFI